MYDGVAQSVTWNMLCRNTWSPSFTCGGFSVKIRNFFFLSVDQNSYQLTYVKWSVVSLPTDTIPADHSVYSTVLELCCPYKLFSAIRLINTHLISNKILQSSFTTHLKAVCNKICDSQENGSCSHVNGLTIMV